MGKGRKKFEQILEKAIAGKIISGEIANEFSSPKQQNFKIKIYRIERSLKQQFYQKNST